MSKDDTFHMLLHILWVWEMVQQAQSWAEGGAKPWIETTKGVEVWQARVRFIKRKIRDKMTITMVMWARGSSYPQIQITWVCGEPGGFALSRWKCFDHVIRKRQTRAFGQPEWEMSTECRNPNQLCQTLKGVGGWDAFGMCSRQKPKSALEIAHLELCLTRDRVILPFQS